MAIMASLVSSERAFSSAGITISKQCNCLDADIVEALQCLKSFIHKDIMVREFSTVAEEEEDMNYLDEQLANQDLTTSKAVRWDDDDLSIGQLSKANCQEAALTRHTSWRRSRVGLGPSGKQLYPATPELTAWREGPADSSQ